MKVLRNIFYLLTPRQRRLARWLWFLPADMFAKKQPLVPPKRLVYTGAGDFAAIGDKIAQKIIDECGVHPGDKILDIGCGLGRIARPLTKYLSNEGTYHGFDVVAAGILWCSHHYEQFPNFHFKYVSVNNDLYNSAGNTEDWQFRFPYEDQQFDSVISISVFTHMQVGGVQNYLQEISRVLRPGKCCFCTFFIINEERNVKFESGNSFFKYKIGEQYLHDRSVKEANVAFDFYTIEKMVGKAGLKIKKVFDGWWDAGNDNGNFDFQDVVILEKN